jgi:hypothetical protein
MSTAQIYLNGIDARSGNYLVPPLSLAEVAALARGQPPDRGLADWFKRIGALLRRPFLGLPLGVDPTNVAAAGWAVVFAADTPQPVREALQPLIAHRQTRVPPDRCKVLDCQPGESRRTWLHRHGVHASDVIPQSVPYYVLLVGGPASIPFEFQYLLDVDYAVGRLAFENPDQYRQYADSVVAYETRADVPSSREVVFWGPRHEKDEATTLSADYLINPLYQGLPARGDEPAQPAIAERATFRSRCFLGDDATRAKLQQVLHPDAASASPALLFTASHGMGGEFQLQGEQRLGQGALLSADWPGRGKIRPDYYLTAADVTDEARVHGLVAFCYACYSAGTPAFDNFLKDRQGGPVRIADAPFVAALPQRLLSHPQGGALAVIGHVERSWGYSIRPPDIGAQLLPFENLIGYILAGKPVGHATKDFSERFASLSAELLNLLDRTQPGDPPSEESLAWTWIERNDAQNYVVLGDPAVRLRVDLLR